MHSISETAKLLGVSAPTLRRWEKTGKLPALRTLGGHRRYPEHYIRCAIAGKTPETHTESTENNINTEQRTPAIYARVSTYKQSADGNLERQIERIKKFTQLPESTPIYSEYGSGLNTDRRGLNRLLKSVEKRQIDTIYIEYRDRLTRFG